MSYQSMNDLYRDPAERSRIEMAAREQAYQFATNADPDQAALGQAVVSGDMQAIDALIAGVVVGPNGDQLDDDAALLSAMQSVWPTVAVAYTPQGA